MYIQITTRCNMRCAHCCSSCTSRGKDMSPEVFKAAISILRDDYICIGGGEPTIHPNFWEFMGLAIAECEWVWIATNGKETKTAIALAKMAKSGVIGAALSQDQWHDPIDENVVKAFTRGERGYSSDGNDSREIRSVSKILKAGRAKKNGIWTEDSCCCEGLMFKPDGNIYYCGCKDAPKVGNVFEPFSVDDIQKNKYDEITCHREIEEKTACLNV